MSTARQTKNVINIFITKMNLGSDAKRNVLLYFSMIQFVCHLFKFYLLHKINWITSRSLYLLIWWPFFFWVRFLLFRLKSNLNSPQWINCGICLKRNSTQIEMQKFLILSRQCWWFYFEVENCICWNRSQVNWAGKIIRSEMNNIWSAICEQPFYKCLFKKNRQPMLFEHCLLSTQRVFDISQLRTRSFRKYISLHFNLIRF